MSCPQDQTLDEAIAHVAECTECQAKAERYRQVAASLPAAYATKADPVFATQVMAKLSHRAPSHRRLLLVAALTGAAMISLFTLNVTDQLTSQREWMPRGRVTAALDQRSFDLFRGGEKLANGAIVHRGDGFTFRAHNPSTQDRQLALFAIDSAGEVHWFAPVWTDEKEAPPQTISIGAKQSVDLPDGIIPEAPALGTMKVIALYSERARTTREIEAALAAHTLFDDATTETLELEVSR